VCWVHFEISLVGSLVDDSNEQSRPSIEETLAAPSEGQTLGPFAISIRVQVSSSLESFLVIVFSCK
jgi:hypothetical protein